MAPVTLGAVSLVCFQTEKVRCLGQSGSSCPGLYLEEVTEQSPGSPLRRTLGYRVPKFRYREAVTQGRSVPNVAFVILDLVFLQQPTILVLECLGLVVFLLVGDIRLEDLDVARAD